MAPATGTAILVLAAFVLPGFVTLLFRERIYAIPSEQTPFERLLNALVYSTIIYGAMAGPGWLFGVVDKADVEGLYAGRMDVGHYLLVAVLGLFVLPVVIALVGARWRAWDQRDDVLRKLGLSAAHGTRSGWDHFFGSNRRAFVRVTLEDGRVVGGLLGYDSLAGYSQQSQDLFLEERWELDEEQWFTKRAPGTLGLWVSSEHLVSLEFYELPVMPDVDAGES